MVVNALTRFLQKRDSVLFGHLEDLRKRIEDWLSYIPQTFPHYTRHTVTHSDEIIAQLSRILFSDDGKVQLKQLSSMEVYILCAAAYLHDAGMVVSDETKAALLATPEWLAWTSESGPGFERWSEIAAMRVVPPPIDAGTHFRADIQTRFLIAEFIRRTHHLRAKEVLITNETFLGGFSLQDPVLLETIGNVCVAHGLSHEELIDSERFPEQRQIRGQTINVRFLAILLRIGDLLDMSNDRACPLLENAACPLPPDSYAHWTQYKRITHQFAGPDRIEITAECENQHEHRQLADWCGWLTAEVQNAQIVMSHSKRHQAWKAPLISMVGAEPTIKIRRMHGATYIPYQWKIEMDPDAVVDRLINDIYSSSLTFVRELIQNSLDATRCRVICDLASSNIEKPESLTKLSSDLRDRYPLYASLREEPVFSELSGQTELRQFVRIEDSGLGMDEEVIQKYLLQVGKSFYKTPDFQRQFGFKANSNFGVGFLSTFAVSDHIVVETYKPDASGVGRALKLQLTGPRNYLLIEESHRSAPGTSVEVRLRNNIDIGDLTTAIRRFCKRVEFPIVVSENGRSTTIRAELASDFIYEGIPVANTESDTFGVRAFPIDRNGIEGELYVFVKRSNGTDYWGWGDWAKTTYPTLSPEAVAPPMVGGLTCINGISIFGSELMAPDASHAERLDYRDGSITPTLSREVTRGGHRSNRNSPDERLVSRWTELVDEHLNQVNRNGQQPQWRYMQSLVSRFPLRVYWTQKAGMIPFRRGEQTEFLSVQQASESKLIAMVSPRNSSGFVRERDTAEASISMAKSLGVPFLTVDVWRDLSGQHQNVLIGSRLPQAFHFCGETDVIVEWGGTATPGVDRFKTNAYLSRDIYVVPFDSGKYIGFKCTFTSQEVRYVLNSRHALVDWVVRLSQAASVGNSALSEEKAMAVRKALVETFDYVDLNRFLRDSKRPKNPGLDRFENLLEQWSRTDVIDQNLRPPVTTVDVAEIDMPAHVRVPHP